MYSSGNYEKYMSKNPLKRKMVERLNERILSRVREAVDLAAADPAASLPVRILDAGCGEGFISGLLYANLRDVEIAGLEYSDEAIEMARRMNPEIQFVQGDIAHMPFENGAFDIVLCTEVLEHLEKPSDALWEISRIAKRVILLTVPDEPWFCLGNLLVLKNVRRLGNPVDHVNHWTFHAFSRFVESCLSSPHTRCILHERCFPWIMTVYEKESNEISAKSAGE